MNADTLARSFAHILARWLTGDERREVLDRNRTADPGVCATHDFCDANEAMSRAFAENGVEVDIQNEAQARLWNEAWNLARDNVFWWDVQAKK